MRSVSKRQKLHDPQAICSVTSFTARPLLRVGGKDKGTRFLSFVDAMLGFQHLLTAEDLGKAASLCTSMRGHLRSRFLVLSDDKPLPPPPGRGKRRLSGDHDSEQSQPSKTLRKGTDKVQVQAGASQTGASQAGVGQAGPPSQPGVSGEPFQVVKGRSRGKKSLPEGVTPIPARTTPRRSAKSKKDGAQANDVVTVIEEVDMSGSESGSNEDDAGSDKTVVDWVIFSSSVRMFFKTCFFVPLSTIPSLVMTDLINL